MMKTAILAILFACTTAAMGQNAGSAILTNPLEIPDHAERATSHTLAQDQNLRGDESPYTYAKGELPLSDFGRPPQWVSLGDVARSYREHHSTAKRATIVWAN